MEENKKLYYYYLGANSPYGFFSFYNQLIDLETSRKLFIIKGGPGTGKSSFMKKIGCSFEDGHDVEYITCSSDPDSLDGILIKDLDIAFVDGTAPHIIDPVFPACCDEIINLGDFWDAKGIKKNKTEIIGVTKKIKGRFESAYRYLRAAKNIDEDIFEIIKDAIQKERLKKLAARISKHEFKSKKGNKGKQAYRFITGITPKGIVSHFDSIRSKYKSVYRLDDRFSISGYLLESLSKSAIEQGFNVIECYCPTDPKNKLEHLIIEDASLAFITSNSYHQYTLPYERKINLDRYVNEEAKKSNRQKIRFNQKLKAQLISSAIEETKAAKALHDDLEGFYIDFMNFKKIDFLQKEIEKKIINGEYD